jgi:hypothetical protein
MFSCARNSPPLQLLTSTELNFPSASAIEFYQDKLYVFGDDATYLLVLSGSYQPIDSISYWPEKIQRITKKKKPDIESSLIIEKEGKLFLTGIGSMSDDNRWKAIIYNLADKTVSTTVNPFPAQHFSKISQLNIEGSTVVNNTIVFGNRANNSMPVNYILFWKGNDSVNTKKLLFPKNKKVAGISSLYYVKEKDMLLITASEEETASTTADGAIGESYLGWIENFSTKMNDTAFSPDQFYKLSNADKAFTKQKIEAVCVEKTDKDEMILHLAADNDNGKSRLFKLRLML